MAARVVAVDAAAEDGDSRTGRRERSSVRLAVDAARETAHDHDAGGGELPPEHPGDLGAVVRAAPRSDDRDARLREQARRRPTTEMKQGRRVVELIEEGWIDGVAAAEDRHVHPSSSLGVR
jgi:hypothetical protein